MAAGPLHQDLRRLWPTGGVLAGWQTGFLLVASRTGSTWKEPASTVSTASSGARRGPGWSWSDRLVVTVYRTVDCTFVYRGDAYVREADLAALNADRQQRNRLRDLPERLPSRTFQLQAGASGAQIRAFRPRGGKASFVPFDSWYLC